MEYSKVKDINIINVEKLIGSLEQRILARRNSQGFWEGHLSSSALSTAVASFALWMYDREAHSEVIERGLQWLVANQNEDGGWGDTVKSSSNQSTTLLCWSALAIMKDRPEYAETIARSEEWLSSRFGSLEPTAISKAILNHYQEDQTFSVPILTFCALSGRLGSSGWDHVPQLPFQLAAFPDKFFKFLNLSVVSYAIPALIAIGLVKSVKSGSNVLLYFVNRWFKPKVLRVLSQKQPANGGFLEASPLTGFVLMSMVGAGEKEHQVCSKAVRFLVDSIRKDGSWPIDTNLSTWVSTLSINALSRESLEEADPEIFTSFLLDQQYQKIHPFTKSKPGGWAWTNLQGGVPDGDDTSGALLALKKLAPNDPQSIISAEKGLQWLMGIQNRDGGIPTFCRGWGKLPFDCSCPDITAHALRAFLAWRDEVRPGLQKQIDRSIGCFISYLNTTQQANGSWLPLWFGNEKEAEHNNPVYGTALVLCGLFDARSKGYAELDKTIDAGLTYLESVQNSNGGWGGNAGVKSSVEETSLALRALSLFERKNAVEKGLSWLITFFEKLGDQPVPATPIGLYFASLWYFEEMYPLTFACSALQQAKIVMLKINELVIGKQQ
jgi:squalene-hopene/tetraprenyl-beta-curcumene cyclase